MLRNRVITVVCCVPILVLAVWFDAPLPWFTVFAAAWGMLAVLEFYRMTGVLRSWPLASFGAAWTLLFIINPHLDLPWLLLLAAGVALSLMLLLPASRGNGALAGWAWMLGGAVYVGGLVACLVALRLGDGGRVWTFLALVATFGSDTAAYFVGRALGRHRLAPRISPGKTWEGAAAGVLGAVIVSLLFTLPTPLQLPPDSFGYGWAVLLGVLIGVFGQFGDLAESLLKRHAGVKDSGKLMPGHGGLLDRMDSVVFAGLVVYLYYLLAVL